MIFKGTIIILRQGVSSLSALSHVLHASVCAPVTPPSIPVGPFLSSPVCSEGMGYFVCNMTSIYDISMLLIYVHSVLTRVLKVFLSSKPWFTMEIKINLYILCRFSHIYNYLLLIPVLTIFYRKRWPPAPGSKLIIMSSNVLASSIFNVSS